MERLLIDRVRSVSSPLLATAEQLKGLPPALVQTAEKDVLRDEGEAYARKLDATGMTVVATRYSGMIPDFGLTAQRAERCAQYPRCAAPGERGTEGAAALIPSWAHGAASGPRPRHAGAARRVMPPNCSTFAIKPAVS